MKLTAAAASTRTSRSAALIQSVFELIEQVVHVLDADGEPHQAIADAKARTHVLGQRRVGHDRRMLDQALHPAQAFGEGKELAALEEAARCAKATLDQRRHHAAIAVVHLLRREQMLRMAGK